MHGTSIAAMDRCYGSDQLAPRATRRDEFVDPVDDQQSTSYQPLLRAVLAAHGQQLLTPQAPGPSMSQLHGAAGGMNSSWPPSHYGHPSGADTPPSFADLSGSVFPPQDSGDHGGFEFDLTLPGETQFPQPQDYNGGEEMARLSSTNTYHQSALSVSGSDNSLDQWMMHQTMMHQTTASLPVRSASHPGYRETDSPIASPLHQESRRSLPPHSRAGRAKASAKSVEMRDSCDPCFKAKTACVPKDGIKWNVCKKCMGNGNLCTYSPKKRGGKGRRSNIRVPAMPNPTGQLEDNMASGLMPLGFDGPDGAASFNMPATTGCHTDANAYSTPQQQGYMADGPVPMGLQGSGSATDYTTAYDGYPTGPSQYSTAGIDPLVMSDPFILSPAAGYLADYVPPSGYPSSQHPMFPIAPMADDNHALYESGIGVWQPPTNLATPDRLQPTGDWFQPTVLESEVLPRLETWDSAGYFPNDGY